LEIAELSGRRNVISYVDRSITIVPSSNQLIGLVIASFAVCKGWFEQTVAFF
jgi:hypothetical protein